MAVEAKHPQYLERASQWARARVAAAGQDAVHAAGVTYLRKLRDQDESEYEAYKMRATFYNATARTISGLCGMLFRKPPKLEAPDNIKTDLKDCDMKGKPFEMFAEDVANECLEVGRVGVLVDHSEAPSINIIATVAVAKELGLRPKLCIYKAEVFINWATSRINNAIVLSMVVLEELYEYPTGEGPKEQGPWSNNKSTEFSKVTEKRWRVLDLGGPGNSYRQRVFRKDTRNTDVDILVSEIWPLMNGNSMFEIPFVCLGPDGIDIEAEAPPLIDLINVNMAHYRVTADYEHGCHFTGLPTPWIAGFQNPAPEKTPKSFYIGSTKAWIFPDPTTKVDYLEFSGQGLQSLENNLDRKESQMAILGARMLAPEKKVAETATTSAIHRTGENSILAGIGISVSLALTKVLGWFAEWEGVTVTDKNILFELNREFMPITVDAPMLLALVKSFQSGAISFDTMFDMLQRGDVTPNDVTAAEEQARIAKTPPPLPGDPGGGPALPPPTNKDGGTIPKSLAAA